MYHFRLQRTDGSAETTQARRSSGGKATNPADAERTLRVLDVRDDDAHQPPALVVDLLSSATPPPADRLGCQPREIVLVLGPLRGKGAMKGLLASAAAVCGTHWCSPLRPPRSRPNSSGLVRTRLCLVRRVQRRMGRIDEVAG
jgi:hypothetical protein